MLTKASWWGKSSQKEGLKDCLIIAVLYLKRGSKLRRSILK